MRIRTLDQDFNGNQLELLWGGNGDVYVNIYENEASEEARDNQMGRPVSVRVGMGGSGMRLPGNMGFLISELAREFEKYKDSKFEHDAYMNEFRERCGDNKLEQTDKDLLYKELCASIPYKVKCKMWGTKEENAIDCTFTASEYASLLSDSPYSLKYCKPYLRPLDTMTDEEKEEMHELLSPEGTAEYKPNGIATPVSHYGDFIPYEYMDRVTDWLRARHFDIKGLIDKGLAIDYTKDIFNPYR